MKKLTKTFLVILLVAATAAASVYGTLAYLKDTDEEVNIMVVGNVDIDLHEQNQNGDVDDAYQQWLAQQTMEPGITVDKIVTVENTGKNPAYLRLYIYVDYNASKLIERILAENTLWTVDADTTVGNMSMMVLTYQEALQPGQTSQVALEAIKLLENVECSVSDQGTTYTDGVIQFTTADGTIPVQVFVEACQTGGFADPYDALSTCFWADGETLETHNPFVAAGTNGAQGGNK